jgi:nitrite reductase/ring-hydroxylating ferredoxin subunit
MRASAEDQRESTLPKVAQAWYVACASEDLGRGPIQQTMLGTPVVLFRSEGGKPAALLDRCAHRNVPLSLGKTRDARIECLYHGWRYDAEGNCVKVPGLREEAGRLARAVPTFARRTPSAASAASDTRRRRSTSSGSRSRVSFGWRSPAGYRRRGTGPEKLLWKSKRVLTLGRKADYPSCPFITEIHRESDHRQGVLQASGIPERAGEAPACEGWIGDPYVEVIPLPEPARDLGERRIVECEPAGRPNRGQRPASRLRVRHPGDGHCVCQGRRLFSSAWLEARGLTDHFEGPSPHPGAAVHSLHRLPRRSVPPAA